MNKTSRIIVAVAVAIVLALGGAAVGYQIGHSGGTGSSLAAQGVFAGFQIGTAATICAK